MKVLIIIVIVFKFSSELYTKPGLARKWDDPLVGLDFLVFKHNHLEVTTEKVEQIK